MVRSAYDDALDMTKTVAQKTKEYTTSIGNTLIEPIQRSGELLEWAIDLTQKTAQDVSKTLQLK